MSLVSSPEVAAVDVLDWLNSVVGNRTFGDQKRSNHSINRKLADDVSLRFADGVVQHLPKGTEFTVFCRPFGQVATRYIASFFTPNEIISVLGKGTIMRKRISPATRSR